MTKREQEVLHLLMQGKSNKQIAQKLDISNYTARDHVSALLRKSGARTRTELIAMQAGQKNTLPRHLQCIIRDCTH
ncbi:LuxR C-terminal-related transcriptional regulator [Pseudomonas sp. Q1-7]|uniref:LuxR C-terminal-related transcriptional regulator n=1 Tax=Pseudomonas sp. Q1-7 TaxID=3020843 RepID=UPI0022FFDD67|nr:LuxR C-terminal-related transcriptional regulator [Pseudomonas sp. Q1-7]